MARLVALVPMKGHSERVPNKNLRSFNGRPLCHWVLNTLNAVSAVDEVVVNTDSAEIADEARELGASVLERPERLRGDHVEMNEIILHDVRRTEADRYLQTHCTNPLLRPETVADAVAAFEERDCDSLFSVTPLQTRLWDADGEPINHRRDELKRTQDLPPVYEENSNLYLFTEASVERRENRIGDDPEMFPMEPWEAIDIDETVDFRIAEMLHRDRYGEEPTPEAVVE
ncbi:cytidylyltransferase domain-containing protein [Salinirubellus sp. GCM10025818]|uniref:acylneuraminate cytidylyltransferase family protein n=1 Tax=Salinirubellus TaxID=2162630 RepID=UPI0030CA6B31